MASNIRVGQLLRVTVRFADFDYSAGTDELLDPDVVTLDLYKYNSSTSVYDYVSDLGPVVQEDTGIYYYDWLTPEDGKFKLVFTGTVAGATPSEITDTRVFYIGTSVPTVTLASTQEFFFLSELDPLYLDPERILEIFSEADIVEVTEIIYRISLRLEEWFGTGLTITAEMEEYLIAATLCELSKTYLIDGGIGGFGSGDNFTLGDLTVNNFSGSSSNTKKNVYIGNASSWCELAFVLKNQLLRSQLTYKAIVKGSNYENPIPTRSLRRFE